MRDVLDLFSGIGGFSLGLERTGGFKTGAFCEIDPYCRRVLAKHWPKVPCYEDVRTLTAERLRADGISVDVICGGFPCQDISVAGKGAGIEGERSGLWAEYARLIRELRPRYVLVENVAALLGRGLDRVLGGLAAVGYDAEWHRISAAAVGAPHLRNRIWIVAYPRRGRSAQSTGGKREIRLGALLSGQDVAHSAGERRPRQGQPVQPGCEAPRLDWQANVALTGGLGDVWLSEPAVGRVAHGVPQRMDRLRALGNAVVPQIPELIGRAILNYERQAREIAA